MATSTATSVIAQAAERRVHAALVGRGWSRDARAIHGSSTSTHAAAATPSARSADALRTVLCESIDAFTKQANAITPRLWRRRDSSASRARARAFDHRAHRSSSNCRAA